MQFQLHLDSNFKIKCVRFSYLLLESNRVYSRNSEESNFHIFHSCQDLLNYKIDLDSLYSSNSPYNISYCHDLNDVDTKLECMGISRELRVEMYKILAAVLHLEKLVLEEDNAGKCQISESSRMHLDHITNLLEIDEQSLERSLLTHNITVNGSDQIT